MIRKHAAALLLSAAATGACTTAADRPTETLASANLTLANGIPVGTMRLLAVGDQISLALAVAGISEGEHGLHLHAIGKCNGPDFASAGGHLNPAAKQHGKLNPDGSHLGDLPNLQVGRNRAMTTTVVLSGDRREILQSIFDSDGTAIVIHAGPDDYRSDPSGNAGSRVACGVLRLG